MWPAIRDGVRDFFFNKAFFQSTIDREIGRLRGLLLGLALASLTYGDQLGAALGPNWANRVKIGGIVLAGLAVMLRAGEKNQPVVELAPAGP